MLLLLTSFYCSKECDKKATSSDKTIITDDARWSHSDHEDYVLVLSCDMLNTRGVYFSKKEATRIADFLLSEVSSSKLRVGEIYFTILFGKLTIASKIVMPDVGVRLFKDSIVIKNNGVKRIGNFIRKIVLENGGCN